MDGAGGGRRGWMWRAAAGQQATPQPAAELLLRQQTHQARRSTCWSGGGASCCHRARLTPKETLAPADTAELMSFRLTCSGEGGVEQQQQHVHDQQHAAGHHICTAAGGCALPPRPPRPCVRTLAPFHSASCCSAATSISVAMARPDERVATREHCAQHRLKAAHAGPPGPTAATPDSAPGGPPRPAP